MNEPRVHVILFSGLLGIFLGEDESPDKCVANYQKLSKLGMKIVFVTDVGLDRAKEALKSLSPEAAIINTEGETFAPELHPLSKVFQCLPSHLNDHIDVIESLSQSLRADGDVVITVGIGGADSFLEKMDLAATVSGFEDFEPSVTSYRCSDSGPDGWNEWAEHMTRRIKIILTRKEMKHNDISYFDED